MIAMALAIELNDEQSRLWPRCRLLTCPKVPGLDAVPRFSSAALRRLPNQPDRTCWQRIKGKKIFYLVCVTPYLPLSEW